MTEALLGRRERKKEETKRRIYEAAIKLFADKGFEATTVDEIAAQADVSKGTFFNYFPRKEAVVRFLFEEWADIGERIAAETHRSAEGRILELFTSVAASFGEKRGLARTVARFSLEEMCAPAPEVIETHKRHDQVFEQIWRQGVERGELRSDISMDQVRGLLGSVFVGAVTWWVGTPDGATESHALRHALPDVIRVNMSMVFDGLRKT